MKVANIIQGTPAWDSFRAEHITASESPVMLGCHPSLRRTELLDVRATGIAREIGAYLQRIFDDGHHFEALARPIAERLINDDLYPVTGASDCGRFGASFDGLTMDGTTAFEHKTLNVDIRNAFDAAGGADVILPEYLRAQMEHQLMVAGAGRALFMASKWDETGQLIEERHCWYYPDPELRARIIAGWEQFERDLADHKPKPIALAPVAAPVEGFGALSLRVEGRVLASNLDAFRAGAESFIARLPKPAELETDQDFADADAAVKACAEAESRIKTAKDAALAQMADVETVLRTADTIAESIRAARLALDKAVKAEKERRKASIVADGVEAVRAHYAGINTTMGVYAIQPPASLTMDIGGSIKGLRTLASITDAVNVAVANAKIAGSQRADQVRASIVVLDEHQDALHLLPDRVALAHSLTPDVLRSVIRDRIDDARARDDARLEAERGCVRAQPAEHLPSKQGVAGSNPAARSTVKLGQINEAIRPLAITAAGLAQLGFEPVGKERAAVLYDGADFDRILSALIDRIESARVANRSAA